MGLLNELLARGQPKRLGDHCVRLCASTLKCTVEVGDLRRSKGVPGGRRRERMQEPSEVLGSEQGTLEDEQSMASDGRFGRACNVGSLKALPSPLDGQPAVLRARGAA